MTDSKRTERETVTEKGYKQYGRYEIWRIIGDDDDVIQCRSSRARHVKPALRILSRSKAMRHGKKKRLGQRMKAKKKGKKETVDDRKK